MLAILNALVAVDGKVTWVFDKENFARQRLRIKARKMTLARMALESTATPKPNVGGGGSRCRQRPALPGPPRRGSAAEARASFRALRAKFPNQLGGREPIVRRTDLGAKGTYYRAMVGPFASMEKAAGMCRTLKAAGCNCLVQRNWEAR